MIKRLKKESGILAISLGLGLLLAFGAAAYTYVYSETTQRNIAENVIRFHVMANSDSYDDQKLKESVRTGVLEEFAVTFSSLSSVDETRALFVELLPELQAHAENIVRREGFDFEVTAALTNVFFPTQFYGSIAFPPGIYEAVQIVIGSGTGQNWWCLMFPPLCYVDMTATDTGRIQLAETVSEEGFRLLTHYEEPSTELVVRFRIVEWWQNRNQPAPIPERQILQR
jgi:stage II sporulation protein R